VEEAGAVEQAGEGIEAGPGCRLVGRLCWLVLLALGLPAFCQTVAEEHGDVVFIAADGARRRLTSSGKDYEPSLSPDGSKVVFARAVRGSLGNPNGLTSQLWIADVSGEAAPTLLLDTAVTLHGRTFSAFFCPQLSPDARRLYFLVNYGAVTQAIVHLDTSTGQTTFVASAMNFWVVPRGRYAGDLVAQVRKPKLASGYYYWFYLLSVEGKELGIVGEDRADVDLFLSMNAR
jgi:dipeptidyl aminopeptidase/acylaminoacyl peptidase